MWLLQCLAVILTLAIPLLCVAGIIFAARRGNREDVVVLSGILLFWMACLLYGSAVELSRQWRREQRKTGDPSEVAVEAPEVK